MKMNLLPLIWLFIELSLTSGNEFTFDATNLMSTTDNWLHEEIPCVGDRIQFDNSMPMVAFMDHNVNVESIQLPDNGMIVFTDNGVDIGGSSNWQCAERGESRYALFNRNSRHDISFFNPANWIAEKHLFLHMNQVPSEIDDVTISSLSSAQIYLDLPVQVNTFKFYKREKMTTEDFNVLLRTMEGQFQINLARPWAHESDQGGVQRLVANDAITVHNKDWINSIGGKVNMNSNNKTLSTICSYIQCPETTKKQCIDSFIPFGHCCPVCGTRIELVVFEMDFEKARAVVFNVLSELESDAQVFATFERKTEDWGNSLYEIAIISSDNITFDGEFHKRASDMMIEKLTFTMKTNGQQSILNLNVFSSKKEEIINNKSQLIACLIYGCIFVVLIGMYVYENTMSRNFRLNYFNPVIKFRRQDDDVVIDMDGTEDRLVETSEEEETKIDEVLPTGQVSDDDVEDWRGINKNFEPDCLFDSQTCFEMQETVRKDDSEDSHDASTGNVTNDAMNKEGAELRVKSTEEKDDAMKEVNDLLNINPNFTETSDDFFIKEESPIAQDMETNTEIGKSEVMDLVEF